jgi:hypothetical protein
VEDELLARVRSWMGKQASQAKKKDEDEQKAEKQKKEQ